MTSFLFKFSTTQTNQTLEFPKHGYAGVPTRPLSGTPEPEEALNG